MSNFWLGLYVGFVVGALAAYSFVFVLIHREFKSILRKGILSREDPS